MGTSAKNKDGILPSLKITISAMAVLMTMVSISSVYSASIPNMTVHGKCDHFINAGGVVVSCSWYTQFPTNISNSTTVWYLHMENGNNLDVLRNGSLLRSNLKSLEYLNLRFCKIRVVEQGAFAGSDALIRIYLSDNLITVLNPDIFKDVPSLRVLRMDNNPIIKIEDDKTFPNFTELIRLDLSNCKLDTIYANVFANLKSLKTLNFTGNNFKRLDRRVFQKINKLTRLSLKNNPWHCDCHVKFLMETLKKMSLSKVLKNIVCASAEIPKWKGYVWNQVPEQDMICLPEINKLTYSSYGNRLAENETLHWGQDIVFECEYSGFPKPEVQWYKDDQIIMGSTKENKLMPTKRAHTQSKIEFKDNTTSTLERLEQDEGILRYKFRDFLAVHNFEVEDKGAYTCVVVRNHVAACKTVTLPEIKMPRKEEWNTANKSTNQYSTWMMWMCFVIFLGLLLVVLTAANLVIVWTRRSK